MAAGATAYGFRVRDPAATRPQGGSLRHRQSDLLGGTDLGDLRNAWRAYGDKPLEIRSGRGWAGVVVALDVEARMVVAQGTGLAPGASGVRVPHAVAIFPKRDRAGRRLISDPWYGRWQWADAYAIRRWMTAWAGPGLNFAVSAPWPLVVPPDPGPIPPPDPLPPGAWAGPSWNGGSW
jgi:hypothetical protein